MNIDIEYESDTEQHEIIATVSPQDAKTAPAPQEKEEAQVVKKKTGAPTKYTEDKAEKVCEMVAEGHTLAEICKEIGVGGPSVLWQWERVYPSFAKSYAAARIASADSFAYEALKHARGAYDSETANIARVRGQILMWMAGRMNPKRYGESSHVDHTLGVEHTKRVIIEHRHTMPRVEGKGKSAGLKRGVD